MTGAPNKESNMTAPQNDTDEDSADDGLLDFTEADIIRWQRQAYDEARNPTPMSEAEIAKMLAGLDDQD